MIWAKIRGKVKVFLSILAVYISATGLVTFSLFITEESIQTAMFGTWQAISANDWNAAKHGYDCIRAANRLLKSVNNCLGWIQPLSFLAYRSYGNSTDAYIHGLEARIFANAPELFNGQQVTVSFVPQDVRETHDGFLHTNRRVSFLSKDKRPTGVSCQVTGVISVNSNKVVITEADGKEP